MSRAPRWASVLAVILTLSAGGALPALAQQASADSVFQRARQLVNGGNATTGRAVVDSLLKATSEASPVYADGLYWRATLSESADQARRDYLRITLDYPLHARAADATLRLAQLEFARGDRAAARRQLERLSLEHSDGATAAQGAYWMGRVLLEDGAILDGCASLQRAKSKARPEDVELLGQISYYSQPCVRARADSVVHADSTAKATADSLARLEASGKHKKPPVAKNPAKGPAWSAQVAAYTQPEDAERLATKLRARGFEARVTEDRPYRVRIGRFPARAGAVALVDKLKAAKMSAIVVEAERP